ncbi:MAG: phosphoserine phosphatase SerB [Pseudomonadota bacterium]
MSDSVISLICNPARPVLDAGLIDYVRAALTAADVQCTEEKVLSPGVALDLQVHAARETHAEEMKALRTSIETALRSAPINAPIDVNVLPADDRRKRLLVADMDSTIIEQECIDEIADFAGVKPQVAAITERAMAGELDLASALNERVQLLKGLKEDVLHAVINDRITLTPGAKTMATTMAAAGARLVLASSGFSFFIEKVAARAGFHEAHGNVLGVADGELTGGLAAKHFLGEDKAATLRAVRDERNIAAEATMAVGDGANDLAMMDEAGLGVAFRAKPAVAAAADCRLTHADLTGVLYLQGYSDAEFVR